LEIKVRQLLAALGFILLATQANALSVSDLSNAEASSALKEALTQGVGKAVSMLGAQDGFLVKSKYHYLVLFKKHKR
jgi:hypothetical protein